MPFKDPQVKETFIKALLSGDFVRMRNQLGMNTDDGKKHRCCIGVLLETCVPDRFMLDTKNEVTVTQAPPGIHMTSLPEDILKQLGLKAVEEGTLITMNDTIGGDAAPDFTEIAEYVKEKL